MTRILKTRPSVCVCSYYFILKLDSNLSLTDSDMYVKTKRRIYEDAVKRGIIVIYYLFYNFPTLYIFTTFTTKNCLI